MKKELENIIHKAFFPKELETIHKQAITNIVSQIRDVYAPIINSLAVANKHNSNLIQDVVRLEGDIIELKQLIDNFKIVNHENNN